MIIFQINHQILNTCVSWEYFFEWNQLYWTNLFFCDSNKYMKLFSIFWLQIQGLGVDGANVMLSQQNGVAGLLLRHNPFCVPVHCVCHRLHLAVSKAAKSVPNVQTLQTIVSTIYQHVNNSPHRLARFKEMAALLAMTEDGNGEEDDGQAAGPYKFLKFKKVFYLMKFIVALWIWCQRAWSILVQIIAWCL